MRFQWATGRHSKDILSKDYHVDVDNNIMNMSCYKPRNQVVALIRPWEEIELSKLIDQSPAIIISMRDIVQDFYTHEHHPSTTLLSHPNPKGSHSM
jgi:hypothetical protein